ncbi:MAG: RNA methyltransferase [Patescibacteria group bacterium]|jgi:tRNA (guanosine-2'-O-)-methyltransferase
MPKRNPHPRISVLPGDRPARIEHVKAQRWKDLELVLEQIDDPHNIGAILRTCDAVGIQTVHLVYENSKPPRMAELSFSAMSALKWLDIKKWQNVDECLADLKKRHLKIKVTVLAPEGKPQWDIDWREPSAIVMGNESLGISPAFLKAADAIVAIPMRGFVQSLNVSVAAAVVMEEALRQRLSSKTKIQKSNVQIW